MDGCVLSFMKFITPSLFTSNMAFSLEEIVERFKTVENIWFGGQYEGYQDLLNKTRYIVRVDPGPMSIALNEIWNMYCVDSVWKGITVANNDGTVRLWVEEVAGDLDGSYFRIKSANHVTGEGEYSILFDIKMEALFPHIF